MLGQFFLFSSIVENGLDGEAIAGKHLGVGELFQYLFAFFLVATKKRGELSLSQHGHAAELLEAETYGLKNLVVLVVYLHPILVANLDSPFRVAVCSITVNAQL